MEKKTIWQCHNPDCNAQYGEYVNGCPKCSSGEPGGSHKVSILNEFHPAHGDGHPQTPEMDLILRIVSQWGNAVEMPNMEGWLKAYAAKATPQGIGWVKEALPGTAGEYYCKCKVDGEEKRLIVEFDNNGKWGEAPGYDYYEDFEIIEWLDEGQPQAGRDK